MELDGESVFIEFDEVEELRHEIRRLKAECALAQVRQQAAEDRAQRAEAQLAARQPVSLRQYLEERRDA